LRRKSELKPEEQDQTNPKKMLLSSFLCGAACFGGWSVTGFLRDGSINWIQGLSAGFGAGLVMFLYTLRTSKTQKK
jgi:hypothetical protein